MTVSIKKVFSSRWAIKWKIEPTVLEPKFFTARKRGSYYTVSIKSNKKQKKTDLDFVWRVNMKGIKEVKDLVGITKILELPNAHVVAKAIELLEHSQCKFYQKVLPRGVCWLDST